MNNCKLQPRKHPVYEPRLRYKNFDRNDQDQLSDMGIMATYSEAGNFPRDILGTLFLCGDCAEPWPWPFTTRYRARDEKRPSLGLLRICSYITLAIHQMRCWNRAGRISTLSERGQSCSSWSSPFAESVLCKTTGQRSQALRTWVQILYLACPPSPALQLIHGLR
jgi:hypothetical protein